MPAAKVEFGVPRRHTEEEGKGCCSPDYRLQININDIYYKKNNLKKILEQ